MPIDFYYNAFSPPCRSVHLTAKALGLELNLKTIDVLGKEHLKPEFVAINPQHMIPTIVDGNLRLWESRAICTYLISQYGKDDSLYPKNPKARCVVDQRLYFDMGTLYSPFVKYFGPLLFGGSPDPANLDKLKQACVWLNDILKEYPYAAGNKMTVADFVLIATISTIVESEIIDMSPYTRIQKWMQRCQKEMKGYDEVNAPGAKGIGQIIKSKLPK